MSEKYFQKALSDFTMDFASGDAIRAYASKGYSITEIYDKLDFPTPMSKVRDIVWKYFVDTGVIVLEEPSKDSVSKQINYEKVQDSFGRTSFKQVVIENNEPKEYEVCDFGKRIYRDKEEFINSLKVLNQEERQYILDLPWPISNVWVLKDSKLAKLIRKVNNQL